MRPSQSNGLKFQAKKKKSLAGLLSRTVVARKQIVQQARQRSISSVTHASLHDSKTLRGLARAAVMGHGAPTSSHIPTYCPIIDHSEKKLRYRGMYSGVVNIPAGFSGAVDTYVFIVPTPYGNSPCHVYTVGANFGLTAIANSADLRTPHRYVWDGATVNPNSYDIAVQSTSSVLWKGGSDPRETLVPLPNNLYSCGAVIDYGFSFQTAYVSATNCRLNAKISTGALNVGMASAMGNGDAPQKYGPGAAKYYPDWEPTVAPDSNFGPYSSSSMLQWRRDRTKLWFPPDFTSVGTTSTPEDVLAASLAFGTHQSVGGGNEACLSLSYGEDVFIPQFRMGLVGTPSADDTNSLKILRCIAGGVPDYLPLWAAISQGFGYMAMRVPTAQNWLIEVDGHVNGEYIPAVAPADKQSMNIVRTFGSGVNAENDRVVIRHGAGAGADPTSAKVASHTATEGNHSATESKFDQIKDVGRSVWSGIKELVGVADEASRVYANFTGRGSVMEIENVSQQQNRPLAIQERRSTNSYRNSIPIADVD